MKVLKFFTNQSNGHDDPVYHLGLERYENICSDFYLMLGDVYSPINSQNTFISRDVIPHYMVLPFVGRMDDIWGGYLVQKEFGSCVVYNKATVYQERNPQDLIKNLENEITGYRNTLNLLKNDYKLEEQVQKIYNKYREYFL